MLFEQSATPGFIVLIDAAQVEVDAARIDLLDSFHLIAFRCTSNDFARCSKMLLKNRK